MHVMFMNTLHACYVYKFYLVDDKKKDDKKDKKDKGDKDTASK